jgi:hypothetical protein
VSNLYTSGSGHGSIALTISILHLPVLQKVETNFNWPSYRVGKIRNELDCSTVLYCYLEHEAVPDLGPTDVLAVGVADAHGAGGGRTRVGDRPRRRQHRHVEAVLDGLHARLVDAADAVGLRLEGDELGMLLDHQDEVCLALEDKKNSC